MPHFSHPGGVRTETYYPGPNPIDRVASVIPHPTVSGFSQEVERSAGIVSMGGGVSSDMQLLRAFLDKQTDGAVMRHFLGHRIPEAPPLLDEALVIALDTEWWQENPKAVTEMGFAELQWWRADCNVVTHRPGGHYPHAAERLQGIHVSHVRIMEFAHLVNSFPGAGDPEVFQFGHTEFIPGSRVPMILSDRFRRLGPGGTFRPIIFVGHDITHDFRKFHDVFKVDLLSYGTVVKVVDTQVLAEEASIRGPRGPLISLSDLLAYFQVTAYNLHNAGQDVAYTMIAAILTSLHEYLYPHGPQFTWTDVPMDYVVNKTMQASNMLPRPRYGCTIFCTRCESYKHNASQCRMQLACPNCRVSPNPATRRLWNTHLTARCNVTQQLLEKLD